jgi:TRAP-type C4-dicarboxylate transport system permease small subunit
MNNLLTFFAKIDADEIPKVPMDDLVKNVLNIVYFVVGIVAVIIVIVAGFKYITSNGEPEKAQKALHTIIDCSIGIAVVIFAFAITNFVVGRV